MLIISDVIILNMRFLYDFESILDILSNGINISQFFRKNVFVAMVAYYVIPRDPGPKHFFGTYDFFHLLYDSNPYQ